MHDAYGETLRDLSKWIKGMVGEMIKVERAKSVDVAYSYVPSKYGDGRSVTK